MQSLTAPPREALAAAEVESILRAATLEVAVGLDLLAPDGTVLADLSEDLLGGEVERQMHADVHGTCHLQISAPLDWATALLRPHYTVKDRTTGEEARFNLGVYVPSVPETVLGESPTVFDVRGEDKTSLLLREVGDTYVVEEGTTFLTAVRDVLADAGAEGGVYLAGDAGAKVLPTPFVWVLTDSSPARWVDVVNDLLSAIGYVGVWADENGDFRSAPYASPSSRAPEWTLDVGGPATVVGEFRTTRSEVSGFNYWRVIAKREARPVVGDGVVEVDQINGALPRRRVVFVDTADQESLDAQAARIVDEDTQTRQTVDLTTSPLPHAGHADVFLLADAALGATRKVIARSWSLQLDGSDMEWRLEVVA